MRTLMRLCTGTNKFHAKIRILVSFVSTSPACPTILEARRILHNGSDTRAQPYQRHVESYIQDLTRLETDVLS